MEEYSPEVQELMDEISTQLREALADIGEQTIEEQAELVKKSLSDMFSIYAIPNELMVAPSLNDSSKVDIRVIVPVEWSWIFNEWDEENEEDMDWGFD